MAVTVDANYNVIVAGGGAEIALGLPVLGTTGDKLVRGGTYLYATQCRRVLEKAWEKGLQIPDVGTSFLLWSSPYHFSDNRNEIDVDGSVENVDVLVEVYDSTGTVLDASVTYNYVGPGREDITGTAITGASITNSDTIIKVTLTRAVGGNPGRIYSLRILERALTASNLP